MGFSAGAVDETTTTASMRRRRRPPGDVAAGTKSLDRRRRSQSTISEISEVASLRHLQKESLDSSRLPASSDAPSAVSVLPSPKVVVAQSASTKYAAFCLCYKFSTPAHTSLAIRQNVPIRRYSQTLASSPCSRDSSVRCTWPRDATKSRAPARSQHKKKSSSYRSTVGNHVCRVARRQH